jgi:curved DNA-binding protein CbpA
MNYYDILEINRAEFDALTTEEAKEKLVKKNYRRLALRWHPDKNPNNFDQATEQFKLISNAYETLSDSFKRRGYNLWLENPIGTTYHPVNTPAARKPPAPEKPDIHLGVWSKLSTVSGFEKAPKANKILLDANKALEKEFNDVTDKLFETAYQKYKQNSAHDTYENYKKREYEAYVVRFKHNDTEQRTAINSQYERKAKPARLAIIFGVIFSPLILPLVAVGLGWSQLKKAKTEKQQALSALPKAVLTQQAWEANPDRELKTQQKWENTKNISLEKFIFPSEEEKTEESEKAHKEYDGLSTKYDKALKNNFTQAFGFLYSRKPTLDELPSRMKSTLLSRPAAGPEPVRPEVDNRLAAA